MIKNKKVIILIMVILLVGIILLQIENSNILKLKRYSANLVEFNCENAIKKKGHISQDEALRIIAVSSVSKNNNQIKMKEYVKKVNSIEIELVENNEIAKENWPETLENAGDIKSQGTYWKIVLSHSSSSYMEKAQFNVNYYTGEILCGEVTSQIYVN